LLDIETSNRIFIYRRLAKCFKKIIKTKNKKKLEYSIFITTFQDKKAGYIKYATIGYILIDGKKFYNEPIIYLDLDDTDIIVGKKWFEAIETLIDLANRRIV